MQAPSVTCWGTGSPLREFLHVDDLGDAVVFCLEKWYPAPCELNYLNVGTGVDLSISELAHAVAEAAEYRGRIIWDSTKPDGTPKKQLDVTRLASMGWRSSIPLSTGLKTTLQSFLQEKQVVSYAFRISRLIIANQLLLKGIMR